MEFTILSPPREREFYPDVIRIIFRGGEKSRINASYIFVMGFIKGWFTISSWIPLQKFSKRELTKLIGSSWKRSLANSSQQRFKNSIYERGCRYEKCRVFEEFKRGGKSAIRLSPQGSERLLASKLSTKLFPSLFCCLERPRGSGSL